MENVLLINNIRTDRVWSCWYLDEEKVKELDFLVSFQGDALLNRPIKVFVIKDHARLHRKKDDGSYQERSVFDLVEITGSTLGNKVADKFKNHIFRPRSEKDYGRY